MEITVERTLNLTIAPFQMTKVYLMWVCVAFLCSLSLFCVQAQCKTELSIESRDELYFYTSDLLGAVQLNPVLLPVPVLLQPAVGLIESLQSGCPSINLWGVNVTGNAPNSFKNVFSAVIPGIAGLAAEAASEGLSINGLNKSSSPTVSPCGMPYQTIMHLGGSANLYVAHLGSGPYRKKIARAKFHTCRDMVIENNSTETIELPVKIQGSVFAAGSFALDDNTFGHALLHVWGSIDSQPFDEITEVKAADIFPADGTIDIVRRFIVATGQGRYSIHLDVNAESLTEVQAKGGGLFGSVTASATAGVDFPHSIEIGRFTGKNGGLLPAGVRIYDANDQTSFYEYTAPVLEILPVAAATLPLRIHAPVGSTYRLESSTDLRFWHPLFTTNISVNVLDYPIMNTRVGNGQYFRVIIP